LKEKKKENHNGEKNSPSNINDKEDHDTMRSKSGKGAHQVRKNRVFQNKERGSTIKCGEGTRGAGVEKET